jgi:hypothetical protein
MVDVPKGSGVRHHDNKRIDRRLGHVEGVGMLEQQVRGSFCQDLKGLDQPDYCGIDRKRGCDIDGGHIWPLAKTEAVLLSPAKVLSFAATAAAAGDVAARLVRTRDKEGHE